MIELLIKLSVVQQKYEFSFLSHHLRQAERFLMDDHTMSFSTLKLSFSRLGLVVYKTDLEGVPLSLMACFNRF